jgi:hypothetical protein
LPYPAASLVTTPTDMGRFIAAHLSGNNAVLPAEWVNAYWKVLPF